MRSDLGFRIKAAEQFKATSPYMVVYMGNSTRIVNWDLKLL